ncbi:phage major capsid protein [bacterium (Candidatus Blackallbacteria) CG18_big_fil_WC_8_21_14_2_50_49_26]|nr:MAG: phage major capsid protein [bacterium (Candidatus Blackallbacteria) CG18_big_fil_WC_8_21_14_2_50_49_26]
MKKELKQGSQLHRSFQVERAAVNEEARTVELAFASETPYERYWGVEILDLSPQSVRLGRMTSGGPLLMDHNSRDHVGVIESVQIGADRVGRAVVRFGKSARAEEVFNDVKDGIRRNVSVGYVIHKAVLQSTEEDKDTYRVSDWEPFEVSLVSVPADTSVGVGRSMETTEPNPVIQIQENKMPEINHEENQQRAVKDALGGEQKRIAEIIAIGEQFAKYGADKLASEALRSGQPVDQFRAVVLQKVSTAPVPTADIGMSEKEAKNYSFLRAINALANPGDRKAQELAAFEREASDAFAGKHGRAASGFFVPSEVQRRDLNVATTTAGGHSVATNLLAASFIDLLRNKMALTGLGAQFLTGLVGNIAIPRATGGATAYWVAESGAPTESQQAFDQVAMTPRTVGAFTDISRKLLLQSSIDVEGFVRNDLATVLALAIDLAGVNGSGASNQPTGILNTSGIGSVAGGTNGLAPTYQNMIDLETLVAVANADVGAMGYLTNAKVRGKLKSTQKVATYGDDFVWEDGIVNGYNATVSNQVPSNLTKGTSSGVCSAILFGNFADLIIGQWGALDLTVDPYTGSTSGTVRVVALQDVDIAVRHAESFAAMKDALTA